MGVFGNTVLRKLQNAGFQEDLGEARAGSYLSTYETTSEVGEMLK